MEKSVSARWTGSGWEPLPLSTDLRAHVAEKEAKALSGILSGRHLLHVEVAMEKGGGERYGT